MLEISDSMKHSFLFEVKYFNSGPVVGKTISTNIIKFNHKTIFQISGLFDTLLV